MDKKYEKLLRQLRQRLNHLEMVIADFERIESRRPARACRSRTLVRRYSLGANAIGRR